ncbi:MAG: alpha-ketoacid dehydrogenase subunit beta, partial [Actinomycetota bacterium]|nr:alpha-ketoacid dehydrogenase subunit beta [Actinomycetota bacterium]
DPVIFLEPKVLYRAGREMVPDVAYELPLGRARVRREGADVTLVTYCGLPPLTLHGPSSRSRSTR